VDYLSGLGMNNIYAYEAELTGYLFEQLQQIPGIRTMAPQPKVAGLGRAASLPSLLGMFTLTTCLLFWIRLGLLSVLDTTAPSPHRYLVAQSTARASLSFTTPVKKLMFIATLKEAVDFFGSIRLIVGWALLTF